jgi:hypothetical protein
MFVSVVLAGTTSILMFVSVVLVGITPVVASTLGAGKSCGSQKQA